MQKLGRQRFCDSEDYWELFDEEAGFSAINTSVVEISIEIYCIHFVF